MIPFTREAKEALERSLREALELGHDYIGTEQVLLALASNRAAAAGSTLVELRVDPDRVRHELGAGLWRPVRRAPLVGDALGLLVGRLL